MTEQDGTNHGLSPEDVESGRAAIERMMERHRAGDYRKDPPVPAKLKSMAPGMRVERKPAPPPPNRDVENHPSPNPDTAGGQ